VLRRKRECDRPFRDTNKSTAAARTANRRLDETIISRQESEKKEEIRSLYIFPLSPQHRRGKERGLKKTLKEVP
jgi:hypothetical protein